MSLTEQLKRAINDGQIDFESSAWIDFVFELLRQEPKADEVRIGNLLLEQGLDATTVRKAIEDFLDLKNLLAAP